MYDKRSFIIHFFLFSSKLVCLCLPFIFGQDDVAELADIEPIQDAPVEVDLSVDDAFRQQINTTVGKDNLSPKIITSTTIPQPFACHECADCKSESDYNHRPCHPGITMCYVSLSSIISSKNFHHGSSSREWKNAWITLLV